MNKAASQTVRTDLNREDAQKPVRDDPIRIDITPHRIGGVDVLSRDHFLTQLHREKRRADRSRAPLSLVVMRFSDHGGLDEDDHRDIVTDLSLSKRETDVIGYFGDGVVVFLLPYSEAEAADAFSDLIVRRTGTPAAKVQVVTYPDARFDTLLIESLEWAETGHALAPPSSRGDAISHGLKRAIDIIGSAVLLILAAPLMLITAIAVKSTSPGPIVFRQMRVGRGGHPFPFYKFRSMRCDNNDAVHREYVRNLIQGHHDEVNEGDADKPVYKMQSDPRITAVGRIIRRTSIDELPQLLNVLKGEMSLVGPRPPIPYEIEDYLSWHLRRLQEVRPGITGLWQVEGRSKTSFDEMVRLDLRYIRDWSLWLDITILFKTVFVVVRGDGAD